VQFIDLKAQQKRIRERIEANINVVLDHGRYIMGPEIGELEKRLAQYVGVQHAVGCSSGTDALLLPLLAMGIGPGDAVFTSPFTFIATAEVISLIGATPVFVDIDPRTYNIDPEKLGKAIEAVSKDNRDIHPLPGMQEKNLTGIPLTPKAIMPVDIFGLPADYAAINDLTKQHGLLLLEDAAQSFGAEYDGKKACSFGNAAGTSFFPAKPLGAYGDGGMCFTDDDSMASKLKSLLVHGQGKDKYENVRIGINGRLDTLQAAVLHAKFDIFPEEIELRREVAGRYNALLDGSGLITPAVPPGSLSAWAQYSILASDSDHRSSLQARLKEAGIPTAIYYSTPLHLQPAFASLGYLKGDFPVSEDCAERIFSLPMHPYLEASDQEKIAKLLKHFEN
jgi:dTDP-4-amino-4,6-dideoxygalactose transaminase